MVIGVKAAVAFNGHVTTSAEVNGASHFPAIAIRINGDCA